MTVLTQAGGADAQKALDEPFVSQVPSCSVPAARRIAATAKVGRSGLRYGVSGAWADLTKAIEMMDDFDLDELEKSKERPQPVYKAASWRPKIGKRLLERGRLLAAWLYITILPQYGLRAAISMILIAGGRLADAASFVVAIHILTRALPGGAIASSGLQDGLTLAAVGLAGVLALGSILGYIGNRLAAKIVLDYESTCAIEGLAIIRHHQGGDGVELSSAEVSNLTRQAPRMMSRSLLHIIHSCTSLVLTVTGLGACLKIFPELTAIVLISLLLMSPFYVYAAVHSTNIGHSIRLNTPGYGVAMRRMQRRWLSAKQLTRDRALEELRGDTSYNAYREAYHARLTLPARNNLLSNLTLAFVVAVSFIWIANEVELSTKSLTSVVSYLVALRLFSHGLAGVFHGIQSINTALPHYLLFLMRDPRLMKSV